MDQEESNAACFMEEEQGESNASADSVILDNSQIDAIVAALENVNFKLDVDQGVNIRNLQSGDNISGKIVDYDTINGIKTEIEQLSMVGYRQGVFSGSPSGSFTITRTYTMHYCNKCNSLLRTRYHCTVCNDFDLCPSCKEKEEHPHVMEKLGFDMEEEKFAKIAKDIKRRTLHKCRCKGAKCRLGNRRKRQVVYRNNIKFKVMQRQQQQPGQPGIDSMGGKIPKQPDVTELFEDSSQALLQLIQALKSPNPIEKQNQILQILKSCPPLRAAIMEQSQRKAQIVKQTQKEQAEDIADQS